MIWTLLAIAVVLTCLASTGFAQSTASEGRNDAYYLGYYGNANMGFPSAEVNIVNPGSTGGYSQFESPSGPYGDLCANIYVFTADQQLAECCSCFVSPNALRTLNIDVDLTSNPLTAARPRAGLIKIVSSDTQSDGTCVSSQTNPAGTTYTIPVAATTYYPEGSLRTWITHIRQTVAGASPLFTLSETEFRHADLGHHDYGTESRDDGGSELYKIQRQCAFIALNGSGHGLCTCGIGD
jgi:hypothetical protein